MADLCGAVANKINERAGPTINSATAKLLESHGIKVEDGQLCSRKLVDSATYLEEQGDFWIASSDPLNTEKPDIRTAEAVRIAAQELAERIGSNLYI